MNYMTLDEVIEKLPSVLNYTSPKRCVVVMRELERMCSRPLCLSSVHLALQIAQREGWVDSENITVPTLWGRRNVGSPAYFKIGSGKRVMTTDVMTEQIDEGFKAPPQTAYAQAC